MRLSLHFQVKRQDFYHAVAVDSTAGKEPSDAGGAGSSKTRRGGRFNPSLISVGGPMALCNKYDVLLEHEDEQLLFSCLFSWCWETGAAKGASATLLWRYYCSVVGSLDFY